MGIRPKAKSDKSYFYLLLLTLGFLHFSFPALSDDISKPEGRVILTIFGNIEKTNIDDKAGFDLSMLETLDQNIIKTETRWTEGMQTFQGVNVKKLLDHVGAKGQSIKAIAINDYAVSIPIEDFANFNVIIAYKQNGKRMRVRDKGPLWIVYPWSDHEPLQAKKYFDRSIWQLKALEVQ